MMVPSLHIPIDILACPSCGYRRERQETFINISVDLPEATGDSVTGSTVGSVSLISLIKVCCIDSLPSV
jgi:hypothetical protein